MPRAKLLAGCLLLALGACKHAGAANSSRENLYGTDDPSGLLPIQPNVEVKLDMPGPRADQVASQVPIESNVEVKLDMPGPRADQVASQVPIESNVEVKLDLPDLPVRQAWSQGGQSLEVHRSASCASDSVEDNGCGNETIYRFTRASRELLLSVCNCSAERISRKVTLSQPQLQEIDRLMGSLEMASGPQVTCTTGTLWELNIKDAQSVEQSYPVALCEASSSQAGRINVRSFQALYEYLKKALPE